MLKNTVHTPTPRTVTVAACLLFVLVQGCSGTGSRVPRMAHADPSHAPAKMMPKAADTRDKEARSAGSARDYELQGDIMLAKGNHFLAFMNFQKALELDPENPILEYKTGLAFLEAGKDDDAIRVFESVIRKAPGFPQAYEGLGTACFRTRQYHQSEAWLRKAIRLDPSSWKSHNYLGAALDARGAFSQAVLEYEAALRINPGAGFVFNNLGISLGLSGDHAQAVEAFTMAIQAGYAGEKV